MSVIDEVKQRLDIVEVIGEYVSLTKAGRTLRALCPFHSEKHPSFYVYPERQSWHCFGACSTGGDVFSFVMKRQGIDFGEALRFLAKRAGVTIPSRVEPDAGRDERERLYQVNAAAAQYFHNLLLNSPNGERARNYVANRGLSLKLITEFQLGFSLNSWEALKQYLMEKGCTEPEMLGGGLIIEGEAGGTHDRFRNKLMFPIFDSRGRITGFGARVLDDSLPKYLNSPQTPVFDKSGSLYGINLATTPIRQQDLAIIVEGYMDVITAHQNGFSNVVASMGIAVTEKQVNTLKRLTRNMALALDADTAGEEAMLRGVGYENTLNAEVKVILMPQGKDPDDVIREDAVSWQKLLDGALPIIDYTFNKVVSELDLTTAKGKSSAVDKLMPIVAEIKDTVRQAHYLQKLAGLVRVSERSLETALRRIKPSQVRRRVKEPEPVSRVMQPLLSSPVEEYCLALLLQHSELKDNYQGLSPEYFENTQNREIFIAWQQASDLPSLKEGLDPTIYERIDSLVSKSLPPTQVEQRYSDCVLNLRRIYLQALEAKRAEALALAAESGGPSAELVELEEQGVEVSVQLGEVFTQKRQMRSGQKGVTQ
jgi:DNA primase